MLALNREAWATSAVSGLTVISKDSTFGEHLSDSGQYFPNIGPNFDLANLIWF